MSKHGSTENPDPLRIGEQLVTGSGGTGTPPVSVTSAQEHADPPDDRPTRHPGAGSLAYPGLAPDVMEDKG